MGLREEEWLQELEKGNIDWFPELVEAYQHKIYALAYRRTRNAAGAEDLSQEIFLQFYRKLPLFRGEAALSTWLYRVAVNRAASYMRKREIPVHSGVPPDLEGAESAEDALLLTERHRELVRAMNRLKRNEREAVELFYFQRHSTAKVAEILSISPRGVETRLRRAREHLRRLLNDTDNPEEVIKNGGPAGNTVI